MRHCELSIRHGYEDLADLDIAPTYVSFREGVLKRSELLKIDHRHRRRGLLGPRDGALLPGTPRHLHDRTGGITEASPHLHSAHSSHSVTCRFAGISLSDRGSDLRGANLASPFRRAPRLSGLRLLDRLYCRPPGLTLTPPTDTATIFMSLADTDPIPRPSEHRSAKDPGAENVRATASRRRGQRTFRHPQVRSRPSSGVE